MLNNYTLAFILYNNPVLNKDIVKGQYVSLSDSPEMVPFEHKVLLDCDAKILPPIPMSHDPHTWVEYVTDVIKHGISEGVVKDRDYGPLTYLLRTKAAGTLSGKDDFYLCSPIIIHGDGPLVESAIVDASYKNHNLSDSTLLKKYRKAFFLDKLASISFIAIA